MSDENTRPLVIGHRGASAEAPENTLAAFRSAIQAGADGIEFDVRLARDGVPVVIHDRTLKRTGRVNASVAELTSKELGQIDVGSWFGASRASKGPSTYAGEHIPTLGQTLEFLEGSPCIAFIELKCEDREVEPLIAAVCEAVRSSPLASRIIIKSFRLSIIARVRLLAPGVRTAALFAPKVMAMLRKEKHLVKIAEEFGAHELSIHYSLATGKLMEKAEKCGLPVNIWTTDNPRWIRRALRLGISSIITNDPARLLERRAEVLRPSK